MNEVDAVANGMLTSSMNATLNKTNQESSLGRNVQDSDPTFQGLWWQRGNDGPVWSDTGNPGATKEEAESIGYKESVWQNQLNTITSKELSQKAPALTNLWATPEGDLYLSTRPPDYQGPTRYNYTFQITG